MTRYFILLLVLAAGLGQLLTLQPAPVAAQVTLPAELRGWAWSSTIGWISMSCANQGSCATSDYGVSVDASGDLSGYGWSENVGWVSFEPTIGAPPSAAGNVNGRARLNTSTGALEGWARVCAATINGDCSNPATSTNAGGWDGWISLQGSNVNSTYLIDLSGNTMPAPGAWASSGDFSWGSWIVGWLSWAGVTASPEPSILSFTATPDEVPLGDQVTLAWEVQGMSSCTASNDNGDSAWNGSVAASDGAHSQPVTPPSGVTTYTLQCSDGSDTFDFRRTARFDLTYVAALDCWGPAGDAACGVVESGVVTFENTSSSRPPCEGALAWSLRLE